MATAYDGTAEDSARIRVYVNGMLDESFSDGVGAIPVTRPPPLPQR